MLLRIHPVARKWMAGLGTLFIITVVQAQESSLMSYGGGRYGAGSCLFRDYQTIGINPANLGIFQSEDLQLTVSAMDAFGLFFSDALPKSQIIPALFGRETLTKEEQESIFQEFLETGNSYTAEVMPINMALQIPDFGGLGFSWRERMSGHTKLSTPLADVIFNGIYSDYIDTILTNLIGDQIGIVDSSYDITEIFNGSTFQYQWLREFNISYGRELIDLELLTLYAGGAVKFLFSNATADVQFKNDEIEGFAAFSEIFDINYGDLTDPTSELSGRLAPVGKGIGFDLGATVSIGKRIFGALAVTDLGSLNYTGNSVVIDDALQDSLFGFSGIDEATIFSDVTQIFNADGLFNYLPTAEKKVKLPSQLRIGGAFRFTDKLEAGLDVVQPLNHAPGNLPNTTVAAMVNIIPIKALKITTGITGGGFSNFDIPLGLSFSFLPGQIWQISIGTQDVITWVTQDQPTVALNLSLFRFHYE